MFKKMFGPKKVEGVGTPISTEDLRAAILTFFPKSDGINEYLTIEDSKDSPDGFNAVWKLYAKDVDSDGITQNFLVTHTIKVDIKADEKAVYLKSKHFGKTARVPKDEPVHNSWMPFIQIGKIEDLKPVEQKIVNFFSQKKSLDPLVEHITLNGWDVFR
ncbi:MAG: hypothetical protein Q7J07_08880 [Pelolinea sp.]|nr:hypothetical protein [Pelolinea sp.]